MSKLAETYRIYHWGTEPSKKINTRSKHHSNHMVEYGRVCEIHLADSQEDGKQEPDIVLIIPESHLHTSHLLFDDAKKRKPLMIELDPETQKEFAKLYEENPQPLQKLKEIAKLSSGYQANRRYPDIKAKPLGYCTHIVYRTIKESDGLTNYIHAFGEPYKRNEKWTNKPILAVAKDGEVFLCGGNYKSQIEGIVN